LLSRHFHAMTEFI